MNKKQILKDKSPYSRKYPKGIKYNNNVIEVEYQKEGKQMRGIVFDNRDRTVHDFYGKTKKDVNRIIFLKYPKKRK